MFIIIQIVLCYNAQWRHVHGVEVRRARGAAHVPCRGVALRASTWVRLTETAPPRLALRLRDTYSAKFTHQQNIHVRWRLELT